MEAAGAAAAGMAADRGPALGLGIVGGLAAGALAGSSSYNNSCIRYEPAYDAYGDYVGSQAVNVCGP